MCAYNRFEGKPCCGSDRLLMQILRDEWKFKYLVVSDCGAINDFYNRSKHHTHPDSASASADRQECKFQSGFTTAILYKPACGNIRRASMSSTKSISKI